MKLFRLTLSAGLMCVTTGLLAQAPAPLEDAPAAVPPAAVAPIAPEGVRPEIGPGTPAVMDPPASYYQPRPMPPGYYWAPGGYEPRVGSPYHYFDPRGGEYRVTGDPYSDHFGPGFHRNQLHGHYRFPYYSYRAPWYYPGRAVYQRDTNFAW